LAKPELKDKMQQSFQYLAMTRSLFKMLLLINHYYGIYVINKELSSCIGIRIIKYLLI